jgi:hypothetical protein
VSEVDQLEDAVHERIAESDETVDGPVCQADEKQAVELGRRLDQVDEQPDEERRDHEGRDRRHDFFGQATANGRERKAARLSDHMPPWVR